MRWRNVWPRSCRGPPPQSALALSVRCGRSRSTRSARLAGNLRGQVINSGEEQLENRRGVCLVVTEDQINRWRFTLQRTAGYGPGQKITRVGGQQRYGAGRRDHGHRMGNVVHFVIRNDIQAGPLQGALDPAILNPPPPKFSACDLPFDFGGWFGVYQSCHEGPPIWEDEIGGDGSDVFKEAFSGALGLAGFAP